MTVSADQRAALSRVVSGLRVLFEDDYADVLEGTFGIHVSGRRAGEIEDASALSLSAHQLAARAELVGVVEYLRGEGLGAVEAVERMLREAVFTTVNRLLAVRVAEAIGVLPPSLAEGRASLGFVEALEVFPLLRDVDGSGGYWSYLQVSGDELSHAVPRLFDRRHPLSVLEPSSETLDAAVELLADPDLEGVWGEAEALGWSYQFFNTQEERDKMRKRSRSPRDSRELAVRNQFFTPGYVVDFLVENTLGRRLRESGLELELPLLLGEVDEDAPPLDLDGVSILDPAVGSGHFLLGAYDLLERAWGEQGVSSQDAAPRILACLFGVDIDARASQVAQAVLYLRARRSAPDGPLEPPQIATARGLPKDPAVWDEVLADVPPLVRDVVEGLGEILEQAPVLGSLLQPEEYLKETIGERLGAPRLGDEQLGSFDDVEAMVIDAAERIASEAASTPAERLFAADTSDALGFVEIMTRRYDTVLMNPPFGKPVIETKDYLSTVYGAARVDLYAAFVERASRMLVGSGVAGALTSRAGFFQPSFEAWRRASLLPRLVAFLDLGMGVLQGAMVEVAAFVTTKDRNRTKAWTARLVNSKDRSADIDQSVAAATLADTEALLQLSGGQFAYWIPPEDLQLLVSLPPFDPAVGNARQGLATADDFRFVRAWWEVDPLTIGKRWFPFAKGGEYSPLFGDIHLVVDWEDDGASIRSTGSRPRIQNRNYYFRHGLTWPLRSHRFSPQALPEGTIISVRGPGMYVHDGVDRLTVLGWAASAKVDELLKTMLGRIEYPEFQVGRVQAIPWPGHIDERVGTIALDLYQMRAIHWQTREESVRFEGLNDESLGALAPADTINRLAAEMDRIVDDSYGRPSSDRPDMPAPHMDEDEREFREISLLLGIAFGRWDTRLLRSPQRIPDPFAAQPPAPFPMAGLNEQVGGQPQTHEVLLDEQGSSRDIVTCLESALEIQGAGPFDLARRQLRSGGFREWVRTALFPEHLKMYSRSSRVAPIYWYLAVPSKEWGLWVYAPRLSRELLFAIAREAQDKMRRLSVEVSQLTTDVHAGGSRVVRERLEAVEGLLEEVGEFHRLVDSVAQSGWDPDLDDGIILNAAPLHELFADPNWREHIDEHRKKMINGDYPWATVQTTYYDRIES